MLFFLSDLFAQVIEDHRCERDSLTIHQANGRLDWAVINRVPDAYDVPMSARMAEKNRMYWDFHPKLEGRPLYPTYGVPITKNVWYYPGNWRAPTSGYSTELLRDRYKQSALCTSSCYRPDMRLFFARGLIDIQTAQEAKLNDLMVLDGGSRLNNLIWRKADKTRYTLSLEETDHELLKITTNTGVVLHVTPNHTFMNHEGHLLEAGDLTKSDRLLRVDGNYAGIVSLQKIMFYGKVLNIRAFKKDLGSQLLAVEGFVTGSSFYQNVELQNANRHLLRRNITLQDITF